MIDKYSPRKVGVRKVKQPDSHSHHRESSYKRKQLNHAQLNHLKA